VASAGDADGAQAVDLAREVARNAAVAGSRRAMRSSRTSRRSRRRFAAQIAEECGRLLGLLDEDLRAVAMWKMEGETNEQIATRLGKAPRTVERKLRIIRGLWGEGEPA
jgi:DNA-binding NarL/FixJ family response regulator